MARDRKSGRIDPAVADRFSEEDIERQAAQDGEDEFFDRDAPPDRVEYPYTRNRPTPVR